MIDFEKFETEGYIHAPDVFSKTMLDAVCDAFHSGLAHGTPGYADLPMDDLLAQCEQEDHGRVYQAQISVGSTLSAYDLIGDSFLLPLAKIILKARTPDLHVMPLMVLAQFPGDKTYDYRWHQESKFYPWVNGILNVWFPLRTPSRSKTGTLALIPGSHLHGEREQLITGKDKFIQIEPKLEKGEEAKQIHIEAKPGDAVFFHADMVHRSVANESDVPRLTGVLRIVNMAIQPKLRPLYKAFSYEA